jgi:DNA repair protein RadC
MAGEYSNVHAFASTMKTLAPHDRPREKLQRLGAAALGDNELLAIVIGPGLRGASALELANALLARADGVHGLMRASFEGLQGARGIGAARAARALAAIELGRRTLLGAARMRPRLATPRDLARFLLPQYGCRPVEQFGLVLLDTKCCMLKTTVLSIGTLDTSLVHPREVFREAATAGAAAVVLFHNHPSGDPLPSGDDAALTRRLVEAGTIMGIEVVDHLILAETRYFSFREAGRIGRT